MRNIEIETKTLTIILSNIGGFWTIISVATFAVLSFFMFDSLLKSQAKVIVEKQEDGTFKTTYANQYEEYRHIMERIKLRLSYVNLYDLFDAVVELDCQE